LGGKKPPGISPFPLEVLEARLESARWAEKGTKGTQLEGITSREAKQGSGKAEYEGKERKEKRRSFLHKEGGEARSGHHSMLSAREWEGEEQSLLMTKGGRLRTVFKKLGVHEVSKIFREI